MLVFFSPSGISSLLKNFPDFKQDDIKIGCFGPTTAKAVKDAGLRLDVEAPTVEAPSMTAALDLYLKKQQDGKNNDDKKGIPFQKKNACRGNVTLTYYSKKDNRSWRFHCGSFIYRWRKRCLPVLPS